MKNKVSRNEYKQHVTDQEIIEQKKALKVAKVYNKKMTLDKLPDEVTTDCLKFAQIWVDERYEIKETNLDDFTDADQVEYKKVQKSLKKRSVWVAQYDKNGDLTGYELEKIMGVYCHKSGKLREGKSAELKTILDELKKAEEEAKLEEATEEK